MRRGRRGQSFVERLALLLIGHLLVDVVGDDELVPGQRAQQR